MKLTRRLLMLTPKRLLPFSVVLLMLSGCPSTPTMSGGVALNTLCREWGRSLPTWAPADTDATRISILKAYDIHEAACPE